MKRVKNLIKLTNLNSESLNEKEQSVVYGGSCGCGCWYSECGGSSMYDNSSANAEYGIHSIYELRAQGNYAD